MIDTAELPEYAKRFRDLLDHKGISQSQLARATQVSHQSIYLVAGGLRQPTERFARRVAGALGVSWEEITSG